MEKQFDLVAIGTIAYDTILRTVDESVFTRDTTLLEQVGISSGGAAMTQAVIAQRLGWKTAVVGKLGVDFFSDYLRKLLDASGVDTSQLSISPQDSTSLTFALVRPDGTRHFLGLAGSNNQSLCLEDFDLDIVRRSRVVSYGSFFFLQGLDGEGANRIFTQAKEAGAITVADAASDSFHMGRETVFRNLPLVDYFIPSYVEAEYLTQERDVTQMARVLQSKGCRTVMIKLGEEGCYVNDGTRAGIVPAFSNLPVCDTTGAGDNFVGGFIAGLLEEMDLWTAVRYANAVAAVSVTGMGAISALRDRAQVMELFKNGRLS